MAATVSMTEGTIVPKLIKFTIPLVLGNLFQLTYNAVDTIIVGKYVGDDAIAAVGTSGPIMNMAILFISGMCMGASILMSSQYGAKDFKKLERQISTTLIGGGVFSIILSAVMFIVATFILKILQCPKDIISPSAVYLRVIFVGLIFTFIYNFFSNTLRALGDSKTPLYFLIISSVFNIFGDLLFVAVFKMGVFGCALSTVISEALCCLFCVCYIKKNISILCLGKKWKVYDRELMKITFSYGITSALQLMCVQLGKVVVQVVVNSQGVAYVAAFTIINKVDDFIMTPQHSIAHAMTTFIAQNKGAGNKKRMYRGFLCGMGIEFIYSAILLVIVFIFKENIMKIFVGAESKEIISLGVSYLAIISFMYLMPALTNGVQGFFRGIGDLKITLASTLINMAVRAISAFILISVVNKGFGSLAFANLAGWIFMMIFELPLLIKSCKSIRKSV